MIFELSLVDLTGTTSRDNTDEVFYNNDSNRDCVGYILSSKFSNWIYATAAVTAVETFIICLMFVRRLTYNLMIRMRCILLVC